MKTLKIPEFKSYEEEAAFWDQLDTAPYMEDDGEWFQFETHIERRNMLTVQPQHLHLDRSVFSVIASFNDSEDRQYWLSRTPEERLQQMEQLRRINYGDQATARLQRILEITQRASG